MKSIDEIAAQLSAPFPKDAVSWRAQTFKGDGTAALALAYIDARDVMNRLDDVCGIGGWQRRYPHANGKTICEIGIKIDGEWIWKADGAGDTDIEAEKGAISDAFKRAAVSWGIGRYLYALDAVWVNCEADQRNGKWFFKKWTVDPWTKVKPEKKAGFETHKQQKARWLDIADAMRGLDPMAEDAEESLLKIWTDYNPEISMFKRSDPEVFRQLEEIKNNVKDDIARIISARAGMPQDFNAIRRN